MLPVLMTSDCVCVHVFQVWVIIKHRPHSRPTARSLENVCHTWVP